MTHRFALAVIVVLQLATISAQPARPVAAADAVDKYVRAEMTRRHIPGVALAIVRGGKVIKAQGYGKADLEHEIPVTPETVFKIGSVSKQFLATGIMVLAQDGRLSVDDPVGKHIDGVPESWRGITLRHFLTHTSGVIREGPAFDALRVQPDIDVIRSAFAAPLEFPTGSKYRTCNVCYFSLAEIIARVSGKPWDVFLTERVFAPTGMSATRTTTTTALVPRRARGYVWRNEQYQNAAEFLALRPAARFFQRSSISPNGTPRFTRIECSPRRAATPCGRRCHSPTGACWSARLRMATERRRGASPRAPRRLAPGIPRRNGAVSG